MINLLICGAMRSGTTALAHYLDEHPEVTFLPGAIDPDEPGQAHYPFASPSLALAEAGLEPGAYQQIVENALRPTGRPSARYIAERRAYFMFYPHIAGNVREHLPNCRLVFILRDPVEVVHSAFWHGRERYAEFSSFDDYVRQAVQAIEEAAHWRRRHRWLERFDEGGTLPLLVERGFYAPQILRFVHLFQAEQLLFLRFDHLATDPHAVMRRMLSFLGLSDEFTFSRLGQIVNAAPPYPEISPWARGFLGELYASSNRRLCAMLGWPDDLWSER
jgi:Sulfotransferase family